MMKRFLLTALFLFAWLGCAYAAPILHTGTPDPCTSNDNKSFVAISTTSATTASIVAASGSTVIYVCHFNLSIAGSATSAATAKLEFGTGSNCGSTQTAITGTYGSNDAVASATPTVISSGDGGFTLAASAAGNLLCLVTAGTSPFVEGMVTFVQQ
jgi:hypothetical protein